MAATIGVHMVWIIILFGLLSLFAIILRRKCRRIGGRLSGPSPAAERDFDVIVVGAGPAGSTTAYFLAKASRRVLLVEKKEFPRAKPCGDAWCQPALDILEEMGVLAKMEADGVALRVRRGGFVSPSGIRCINTQGDTYGSVTGCKTYAIKRERADEYLARVAGAMTTCELREQTTCNSASFVNGAWHVDLGTGGQATSGVLVICDGSTSYLAQKLGIVHDQADSVCSHSYIKAGTHNWGEADGVMLFNRAMLPGYSALFRHADDDVYLGTYVLPGGAATSRAIGPFESEALDKHPYISNALPKDTIVWAERRVVAPIRTGAAAIRNSDAVPRCLVVGDAAGHVDPLTGEGIHTAMVAAKIAATCIDEMYATNDFSRAAVDAYYLRCKDAFGFEFTVSQFAAKVIVACPALLDGLAAVGKADGQPFLDFFGECMTGCRPKSHFVTHRPWLALRVAAATLKHLALSYMTNQQLQPVDIGQAIVNKHCHRRRQHDSQDKKAM